MRTFFPLETGTNISIRRSVPHVMDLLVMRRSRLMTHKLTCKQVFMASSLCRAFGNSLISLVFVKALASPQGPLLWTFRIFNSLASSSG